MPNAAGTVRPLLGPLLEAEVRRYDRAWLASDPLWWPRRFEDRADREVVAIVAALLAYGRVATIQQTLGRVVSSLGPAPSRTVEEADERELGRRLRPVVHRFTRGEDLAWLLAGVGAIRRRHGSVGRLVEDAAREGAPLRSALVAFRAALHARPGRAARAGARAFLVPDPALGGACKRLLLLMRWCVRGDDGLDLGLWGGERLTPADLLLPLDAHAFRFARHLGLTRRARADWRTAEEVTAALRQIDPDDPTRFDFALVRPGIVGRCRHRHVPAVCGACPLAPACDHGGPARRGSSAAGPPRPEQAPGPRTARATSGNRTSPRWPRTRPSRRPSS